MYSFEISELMKNCRNNIDSETYIEMIDNSPQLNHIIYKPFDNCFEMWDSDGEYWRYTVYKK